MLYSRLAGFLVLLGFLLHLAAAGEDHGHKDGCKLTGKYIFDSDPKDPKSENLLNAIGYSAEDIQKIQALAPGTSKEISYKDGMMTLKLINKMMAKEHTFENGKEFTEAPMIGVPVQTTPKIEKSKLTLVRKTPSEMEITEVLTCAEDGCTAKFSIKDKDATAEIKWKRIQAKQ